MHSASRRLASRFFATVCLLVASLSPASLHAEPPSLAYFFPMGGRRGETVKFKVGGHFLHGRCRLEGSADGATFSPEIVETETVWFEGPLIRQPLSQQKEDYPRDYAADATIAADAALGPRPLRCWTSQGITAPLSFHVGDLPEVIEDEGSEEAVAVKLPATINGRIFPREDRDRWTFALESGQTLSVQAYASRLGLDWRPRLALFGPDGVRRLEAAPGPLGDPELKFVARETGIYALSIEDSNFGGLQHYVYRLVATIGESVDAIYPLSVRPEKVESIELVFLSSESGKTKSVAIEVNAGRGEATTFACESRIGAGPGRATSVLIDDAPATREVEPNDSAPSNDPAGEGIDGEKGSNVVFHGRIQTPGDVDRWTFRAKKGAPLTLDLQAAALGGRLDATLAVLDEVGKELARSDDRADGQPDPRLSFQAPADGLFVAVVASRFAAAGDLAHVYRLKIGTPEPPPFRLTVATDSLLVPRGGELKLPVKIERAPGHDEPIELTLVGLPEGLSAAPAIAAKGARDATLLITATADAKIRAARVSLRGVMKHAEKNPAGETSERVIERAAEHLPPKAAGPEPLDLWAVAVVPTPFKLAGEYLFSYAPRGGVSKKPFKIERNGYAGPIEVRLADRQTRHLQGVTGPTLTLAADASEFVYPVGLPPWMELGRTSRSCIAAFGVVEDPDGTRHVVSHTSQGQNDQIIVIVDPEVVKLRLEPESIALTPGGTGEVAVNVERPAGAGAVTLEVVASKSSGVTAPAATLTPDQPSGKLALSLAPEARSEIRAVTIRATTHRDGDALVGEATLDVVTIED